MIDKVAAHRLGIFIDDYNRNLDRQRIMQAADMGLAKGTLTQDQWFIVTQTADPKRANALLSRLLKQKEKRDRAFAMQQMDKQDQMNQAQFERQVKLLEIQGQLDMQKAQIPAGATVEAAQLQADSRIQTKQIQVANEPIKQDAKTQGQKDILQKRKSDSQQRSMTRHKTLAMPKIYEGIKESMMKKGKSEKAAKTAVPRLQWQRQNKPLAAKTQ